MRDGETSTKLSEVADRLDDIFVGDGEMARLMRAKDWSATPLGPPGEWPNALKVALRLLLTSRFEMWLGWGPDIAFFYNDAYRPTLGDKHPASLGTPAQELWSEIWSDVGPLMRGVYDNGEATWNRDMLLLLERRGFPEETYHTFSYSPLIDDDGKVSGLFCAVSEETDRVITERRMETLRELSADLSAVDTTRAVLLAVEQRLGANQSDLPFTLTFEFKDDGQAKLVAATGGIGAHPAATDAAMWQAPQILAGRAVAEIDLRQLRNLPTGAWSLAPTMALAAPLPSPGRDRPAGMLVVGVNPHRTLDDDYVGFAQLLAGQIAAGLSSAGAYESERARAEGLAEIAALREAAAEALAQLNESLAEEVAARTSERDRMHDMFQQAPGFMCMLRGRDLVFELVNDSYRQLVGHRDVLGMPIRQALPEVAGQGFFELLDEVMETGKPFVGRNLRVMLQNTPDAPPEERFLHLVYQPILDADGVSGVFAEGSDVTEQVWAENELRRLNETLEARVAERTEALAEALDRLQREASEREAVEDALRQAQKMEAVGQLTGGIAHDFNNLLTGVLGSIDLMQKRLAQGRMSEVDRYAATAESAAKRAAALTHRLLAFSRRQPLDPRAVDANRLVASMEELLRRTLGEAVELEVVRAAGLWTTLCDPHQLESAILNLAINSRDAMPDGGKLTIETANALLDDAYTAREGAVKAGQYVCVCVTDTGVGMSGDVIAKAFEPFFTTKPIGQGTGLGLSMIYGFAQQSNGYAKIYSELGQGTTVKLYLPRHFGVAEQPEQPSGLAASRPAKAGGKTVLVVEDEPSVRNLVIDVLHERGYATLEAADGQTGLQILQGRSTVDLLISDVGLPGLNGRQLADAARAQRPDLPILFMTGYAENAAIAGGFLEPGMEMITKPFAVDVLVGRVASILKEDQPD
ncbi:MAG: response regulator [Phenylobacterium sp.]